MTRTIKHRIYCSALLLLLSSPPLLATSILEMNLQALTKQSTNVVTGRVISQQSQFDGNQKLIWTYSTVEVDQGIKGGELETLVIQQAGGAVGDTTQIVHGISLLKPSEEVLLFVAPTQNTNSAYKITGLSQGMYRLRVDAGGNKIAKPVIDSKTHYLSKNADGKFVHSEPSGEAQSLSQLIKSIKAIN